VVENDIARHKIMSSFRFRAHASPLQICGNRPGMPGHVSEPRRVKPAILSLLTIVLARLLTVTGRFPIRVFGGEPRR